MLPKFPKLKYPTHESVDQLFSDDDDTVVITEKVDGANFRFRYLGEEPGVVYGSRNVLFTEDGDPLPIDECNKQFRHAIEYIEQTADFDALEHPSRYAFYGEALHKHSIDYDAWEGQEPDGDFPNVMVFQVYDGLEDEFVGHRKTKELTDKLGIAQVPYIATRSVEWLRNNELDIPESVLREPDPCANTTFDRKGLAEGLVLHNQSTGQLAKLVHDEFKEKNAISFNDPSKAQTEAGRFVATYCTDARIEKHAHKLIDEGDYNSLTMSMMEDLPRRVLADVMAEEGWEILTNDMELTEDVKGEIRSKASKRCVRVLKNMVNSLSAAAA